MVEVTEVGIRAMAAAAEAIVARAEVTEAARLAADATQLPPPPHYSRFAETMVWAVAAHRWEGVAPTTGWARRWRRQLRRPTGRAARRRGRRTQVPVRLCIVRRNAPSGSAPSSSAISQHLRFRSPQPPARPSEGDAACASPLLGRILCEHDASTVGRSDRPSGQIRPSGQARDVSSSDRSRGCVRSREGVIN